jgi:hypothetical protein
MGGAQGFWYGKLHSGGWIGIAWLREYGGRDAGVMQRRWFFMKSWRASTPRVPYIGAGVALAGPTPMEWGTEAQKQRFIQKILSGEETWCQGYSERNAGSDLTSLAIEEGDYFVVNGSKIGHRKPIAFLQVPPLAGKKPVRQLDANIDKWFKHGEQVRHGFTLDDLVRDMDGASVERG